MTSISSSVWMGRSIALSSHSRNRLFLFVLTSRETADSSATRPGGDKLLLGHARLSDRRCDGVPSDRSTDPIEGSVAQVCLSQTGRKDRRRTHPRSSTRSSLLTEEKVPD